MTAGEEEADTWPLESAAVTLEAGVVDTVGAVKVGAGKLVVVAFIWSPKFEHTKTLQAELFQLFGWMC
jgi:hypothetical protein